MWSLVVTHSSVCFHISCVTVSTCCKLYTSNTNTKSWVAILHLLKYLYVVKIECKTIETLVFADTVTCENASQSTDMFQYSNH